MSNRIMIDQEWSNKLKSCHRYPDYIDYLPDHILIKDSDSVMECKKMCAIDAMKEIRGDILTECMSKMDKRIRNKLDRPRFMEFSDEESEDDYYTLKDMTRGHDPPRNSFDAAKLHKEELLDGLSRFGNAIPYCYPATFHLMCNGWQQNNGNYPISFCPLCPDMMAWRRSYNLNIDDDYLCMPTQGRKKNKGKMKPHALKDHVKHMSGYDKREYHKLYLKYLEFLERELPACIRISFDKKLNRVVYPGGKPEIFKKTSPSFSLTQVETRKSASKPWPRISSSGNEINWSRESNWGNSGKTSNWVINPTGRKDRTADKTKKNVETTESQSNVMTESTWGNSGKTFNWVSSSGNENNWSRESNWGNSGKTSKWLINITSRKDRTADKTRINVERTESQSDVMTESTWGNSGKAFNWLINPTSRKDSRTDTTKKVVEMTESKTEMISSSNLPSVTSTKAVSPPMKDQGHQNTFGTVVPEKKVPTKESGWNVKSSSDWDKSGFSKSPTENGWKCSPISWVTSNSGWSSPLQEKTSPTMTSVQNRKITGSDNASTASTRTKRNRTENVSTKFQKKNCTDEEAHETSMYNSSKSPISSLSSKSTSSHNQNNKKIRTEEPLSNYEKGKTEKSISISHQTSIISCCNKEKTKFSNTQDVSMSNTNTTGKAAKSLSHVVTKESYNKYCNLLSGNVKTSKSKSHNHGIIGSVERPQSTTQEINNNRFIDKSNGNVKAIKSKLHNCEVVDVAQRNVSIASVTNPIAGNFTRMELLVMLSHVSDTPHDDLNILHELVAQKKKYSNLTGSVNPLIVKDNEMSHNKASSLPSIDNVNEIEAHNTSVVVSSQDESEASNPENNPTDIHGCTIDAVNCNENSFEVRDGVYNNSLSGKQERDKNGRRYEIVNLKTISGIFPIRVFANDYRTDLKLARQAKKDAKWLERRQRRNRNERAVASKSCKNNEPNMRYSSSIFSNINKILIDSNKELLRKSVVSTVKKNQCSPHAKKKESKVDNDLPMATNDGEIANIQCTSEKRFPVNDSNEVKTLQSKSLQMIGSDITNFDKSNNLSTLDKSNHEKTEKSASHATDSSTTLIGLDPQNVKTILSQSRSLVKTIDKPNYINRFECKKKHDRDIDVNSIPIHNLIQEKNNQDCNNVNVRLFMEETNGITTEYDITGELKEPHNILVVGMCYNRNIINEMKINQYADITSCTDKKGKPLSQNVMRDTWRCYQIEEFYPSTKVFTCSLLKDNMRDLNDDNNLNCDINTSTFIKSLMCNNWEFTEIYFDTIRMYDSYLSKVFNKNLLRNIIHMTMQGKLKSTRKDRATIYFPFCPHFLKIIHADCEITKFFDVSYLEEDKLSRKNHKLWFITSIANDHEQLYIYDTPFREHMDNVTFTRQQIKKSLDCPELPKGYFKTIHPKLGDVTKIRYIVLELKKSSDAVLSSDDSNVKTNSKLIENIDLYSTFLHKYRSSCDMKSVHLSLLLESHPILNWCNKILIDLIHSKPGTKNGITVATEEPLNNGLMLNVSRPGVLRQYYGVTKIENGNNTCVRATFGYINGRLPVSIDPFRYSVKPFSPEMQEMSDFLRDLLMKNSKAYGLEDVNLSLPFNTCTVLLYHSIKDFKKESNMGFHTDLKFSKNGSFRHNMNSQKENTVTVIVTFGNHRIIKWRQRMLDENNKWITNKNFDIISMILKHGDITILHPKDETPHLNEKLGTKVIYEHGKILVEDNCSSVGYVFRVVVTEGLFNTDSNLLYFSREEMEIERKGWSSERELKRSALYSTVQYNKYHELMKNNFSSIIFKT